MTRVTPTPEQQAAIDLLTANGYTVVRRRTYERLREAISLAKDQRAWDEQTNEHVRAWALDAFREQRRLADRLDRVVAAAAALGVSIQDINTALDGGDNA